MGITGFRVSELGLSFHFCGSDRFAINEKRVDIAYPLFHQFTAVKLMV